MQQWVTNFVRANSVDRKLMDPAGTPAWFSLVPNVIGKPDMHQQNEGGKTGGLGAPDIAYAAGIFKLEPDEALIVRLTIPKCQFANIALWNRYLQTFDYAQRQISLNRRQMKNVTADGRVTVVLAPARPRGDAINWIDTEGRGGGNVFIRYVLPEGDMLQPETRVVKLADLPAALEA